MCLKSNWVRWTCTQCCQCRKPKHRVPYMQLGGHDNCPREQYAAITCKQSNLFDCWLRSMELALIHGWVTTLSDKHLNVTAPLQKNKAVNTRWSPYVYRGRASKKREAASQVSLPFIQAQSFSRIHLIAWNSYIHTYVHTSKWSLCTIVFVHFH